MLMLNGQNVWVAMFGALLAGMAAGLATGILHTFMGIPAILAGILTQLGLYSVNLKIMGKANQAINVDKYPLLVSLRFIKGVPFFKNTIFIVAIIIMVLILLDAPYVPRDVMTRWHVPKALIQILLGCLA